MEYEGDKQKKQHRQRQYRDVPTCQPFRQPHNHRTFVLTKVLTPTQRARTHASTGIVSTGHGALATTRYAVLNFT
jgi:hypothetical protein